MLKKYIITLCMAFMCMSCKPEDSQNNLHQKEFEISTQEDFLKYKSTKTSENIKFSLGDFVGIWSDPRGRDMDFTFRSDLSLELDWRKGKCKILEQTNNTLLLQCEGEWGVGTQSGPQYVRLQLFYYSKTQTTAELRMNITFNQDLDCARKGFADINSNCFIVPWTAQTVATQNFDMYYKNK